MRAFALLALTAILAFACPSLAETGAQRQSPVPCGEDPALNTAFDDAAERLVNGKERVADMYIFGREMARCKEYAQYALLWSATIEGVRSREIAELALKLGGDVNGVIYDETPLEAAIKYQNVSHVIFLLIRGADPDIRVKEHHYAAREVAQQELGRFQKILNKLEGKPGKSLSENILRASVIVDILNKHQRRQASPAPVDARTGDPVTLPPLIGPTPGSN